MSEPPHPLELIDRERVLQLLTEHLSSAWTSFESARPKEPQLDQAVVARLSEGLPAAPGDPEASLADIASVLDASISPSRPLYTAYIGSTGLEAIEFSQLFSGPSFLWSVGPQLAQTLFDAGKTHGQALRALSNRLVGILHGCLATRTLYDEAIAWNRYQKSEIAA